MKSTFRKVFMAAAITAAAALTTTSAMAEKVFHVPFSFNVDGKAYPAGSYRVDKTPIGNSVILRNTEGPGALLWAGIPGEPLPTDVAGIMTFDRLDSGYELRTIQYGNLITPQLDRKAIKRHRAEHPAVAPISVSLGQ